MELKYPLKSNGMFCLRKDDFDNIASMVLSEFEPEALKHPQPIDIMKVAQDGLFMTISTKNLDVEMNILGVTAFSDGEFSCLDLLLKPEIVELQVGSMLLHTQLTQSRYFTRTRFTIAHEVSHFILHRTYHSPRNERYQFRTQRQAYVACRSADVENRKHEFGTEHDWLEWQANSLASTLLMPKAMFQSAAEYEFRHIGRRFLTKGNINTEYLVVVTNLANLFRVSKTSAELRLKQLGYIQ